MSAYVNRRGGLARNEVRRKSPPVCWWCARLLRTGEGLVARRHWRSYGLYCSKACVREMKAVFAEAARSPSRTERGQDD